jgi:acyl carrier protein
MADQNKLKLLAEMFEMEEGSLNPQTELASLENWDSMTKLSLIVLMDDEFDKKLSGEQIRKFSTIQDILDYMG